MGTSSRTDDAADSGPPLGGGARYWVDAVVVGSPWARAAGVELVSAEVDRVALRLPFADHLTTVPGILHGGVVATAVDTAGAAASATGVRDDEGRTGGATTHLTVAYLAPARTGPTVVATVVHRTRSTTHSEVTVHGDAGDLVATGQVTSRIFH